MGAVDRIPILFGEGLDRATGVMAVDPALQSDLRNVTLYEGKSQFRAGLLKQDFISGVDDIIAMLPFRYKGQLALVAWIRSTGKAVLYVANSRGQLPALVESTSALSTIWTPNSVVGRPVLDAVENNRRLFFAHTYHPYKPGGTVLREQTKVYNPAATAGSRITGLTANLDNLGSNPVRFAGVTNWLGYLVGWGFGTNADPDRPEIVRVSEPGDPLTWTDNDYFIAGIAGDPVITCRQAANLLLVFKGTETYECFGYDRRSFGIRPADLLFGCLGPHLALTVGGVCYFWSAQGPRVSQGGASADLSVPLDILGAEPSDLPTPGPVQYAFSDYDPIDRKAMWFWPDLSLGTVRVYTLHMRNPSKLRWSYDVIGRPLASSCVFPVVPPRAISGYPDPDTVTGIGGTVATVPVVNTGNSGDETIELWLKLSGVWSLKTTGLVTGAGTTQNFNLTGLTYNSAYTVATRYIRDGFYDVGAESSDPGAWPSNHRITFSTLNIIAAPTSFGVVEGSAYYLYSKYYEDAVFSFNTVAGRQWELWEYVGTSVAGSPPGGSYIVASGTSASTGVESVTLTNLVPPSGSVGHRTYWVRFSPVPLSDYAGPVGANWTGA